MINIPYKISVDQTKFNFDASLVAFKTAGGDVYVCSSKTGKFINISQGYFYSSFIFDDCYFYNNERDKIRAYKQKNLKYSHSVYYYGLNRQILSSSIFTLCLNQTNKILLLTNKGKIIRTILTISPDIINTRYQFLNQIQNNIMILSNYIDSELNLLSYGSISKLKKLTIDMINMSYYAHYDDNFKKFLQILRDEQLIFNYYYNGKNCVTSDDFKYETFYQTSSNKIQFFDYSVLEFEKPYLADYPIRYAKRLDKNKLAIIYNDKFQIIDL